MSTTATSNMRGTPFVFLGLLGLGFVLFDQPSDPRVAPPARPLQAEDASATVGELETLASRLAEERGRVYVALHSDWPIDEPERIALDASRAGDPMVSRAIARLETMIGRGHLAVTRVHAAHRRIATLRAEVDHAVALPREARDATLATTWFRRTSELIEALHHGARFAGLRWAGEGADLQRLITMQLEAWRISETVGRERAVIGAAIANAQPLTQGERNTLMVFQNRLTGDWRRLEHMAASLQLSPQLANDMERVRQTLFGELSRARGQVLDASLDETPYPYTPWQWFSIASRTVGAAIALRRNAEHVIRTASSDLLSPSQQAPTRIAGSPDNG